MLVEKWALAAPEPFGIWGATTARERMRMLAHDNARETWGPANDRASAQHPTAAVSLVLTGVSEDQTRSGPQTGSTARGNIGDIEVGVWEMTVGAMCDVEPEEFSVVLSASTTIEFDDGSQPLHLTAGHIARLKAGTRTVGTISSPCASPPSPTRATASRFEKSDRSLGGSRRCQPRSFAGQRDPKLKGGSPIRTPTA